ncbi:MAG: Na/Pi cotransporter family protein [Myxococcota bacterium]
MIAGLVQAAGGLGLFLLGMVVMTDGLRGLAGDTLQRVLRRFTRSPASGAATGAVVTALVQSSSATTVTAVGFAGAGLMTFPAALGIVFGANLGTTITGWMVALLGFKVQLGLLAPLAVLFGVLLRLFGRGRWSNAGTTLAGFGLVFLGIAFLRDGLGGLEGLVTPEQLPGDGLGGRLALVGIGVAITLVTQSSSAGVATALAALSVDAIRFDQAAALVIGMDVGTTATAAMATVGASLPARRTGWAHVLYNLLTASGAFLLLPVYLGLLETSGSSRLAVDPAFGLVAFHSLYNALGVAAILPFAAPFARMVERIVPERPSAYSDRLDRSLLSEPEVAIQAVVPTLADLAVQAFAVIQTRLEGRQTGAIQRDRAAPIAHGLDELQHYLALLGPASGEAGAARRAVALHCLDQLARLVGRLGRGPRPETLAATPELLEWTVQVDEALPESLDLEHAESLEGRLEGVRAAMRDRRPAFRDEVADRASRGEMTAAKALEVMDAFRWLERVAHHSWRVVHHWAELGSVQPSGRVPEPPDPE